MLFLKHATFQAFFLYFCHVCDRRFCTFFFLKFWLVTWWRRKDSLKTKYVFCLFYYKKMKFKKLIKSCTACVAWDIAGPNTQPMHFTMHLTRRIYIREFNMSEHLQKMVMVSSEHFFSLLKTGLQMCLQAFILKMEEGKFSWPRFAMCMWNCHDYLHCIEELAGQDLFFWLFFFRIVVKFLRILFCDYVVKMWKAMPTWISSSYWKGEQKATQRTPEACEQQLLL